MRDSTKLGNMSEQAPKHRGVKWLAYAIRNLLNQIIIYGKDEAVNIGAAVRTRLAALSF